MRADRTRIRQAAMMSTAALASMAVSVSAYGAEQAGSDSSSGGLTEIVVTAQKRPETAQTVPIAISVISTEDIADRQLSTLTDLAKTLPSIVVGDSVGQSQISIRGVGFGMFSGSGENSVAVHRDGIYISQPFLVGIAQEDLGSIEILRGPQGTLWGRNATAGVVNFKSADPSDVFEAGFTGRIANHSTHKETAYLTGPLGPNASARIAVSNGKQGGYVDNLTNGESIGGVKSQSVNGGFDIDGLFGGLDVQFRGGYYHDKNSAVWYEGIEQPSLFFGAIPVGATPSLVDLRPYKVRLDNEHRGKRDFGYGSLRMAADVGDDIQLVSLTGYSEGKFNLQSYDSDGSAFPAYAGSSRVVKLKSFSQEVDLIAKLGALDLVVGGYYLDEKLDAQQAFPSGAIVAGAIGLGGVTIDYSEKTKSYSAFIDGTYHASDRLRFYGGARYIGGHRKSRQSFVTALDDGLLRFLAFTSVLPTNPAANPADFGLDPAATYAVLGNPALLPSLYTATYTPVPLCQDLALKLKDDAVTGRAGVQYDAADRVMLYGQYARGYKSGTFSNAGCGETGKPEKLNAFEIGLKSDLFNRRVRINAAAYYYDYKDLQYEEIIAPSAFMRNADARILGFELEATALVTQGLTLDGSLSLMKAEYKSKIAVDNLDPGTGPQDLDGQPLMRSPKYSFLLGAEYSTDIASAGNVTLRGEVQQVGSYRLRTFESSPLDRQKSYTKLNAFLTYKAPEERFILRAFGKNLSNEAVKANVIDGGNGFRLSGYDIGRTFGLELAVKFGGKPQ